VGIRDSFPGVKAPEHASRHVIPSSAKDSVRNFMYINMCIHDVVLRQTGNFNVTCKKILKHFCIKSIAYYKGLRALRVIFITKSWIKKGIRDC
jgi:hypothetical protein